MEVVPLAEVMIGIECCYGYCYWGIVDNVELGLGVALWETWMRDVEVVRRSWNKVVQARRILEMIDSL